MRWEDSAKTKITQTASKTSPKASPGATTAARVERSQEPAEQNPKLLFVKCLFRLAIVTIEFTVIKHGESSNSEKGEWSSHTLVGGSHS